MASTNLLRKNGMVSNNAVVKLKQCSVVIPCRNESRFIAACLDSVLANDYPQDKLEILVVDGMSEDGTRTILADYARRFPFLKVLDNPKKNTPAALNTGIVNAHGDVLLRMDAHALVETNYISRCVESLTNFSADNIGGIMKTFPQKEGLWGVAIVTCLSHPFGVGNSYFRIHTNQPKWVDTVFGGCYRKEVFQRVGLYNEKLARGQDMEFNLRLKKAGGKILLVPDIVSYYYARSDIKSFLKHNWDNGVWAILPFMYSDVFPVSWRHLIPLVFVVSLMLLAFLGIFATPLLWLFWLIAATYSLVSLAASLQVAWTKRNWKFFFIMPVTFWVLHFAYGLGSFSGCIKLLVNPIFWNKVLNFGGRYETGSG